MTKRLTSLRLSQHTQSQIDQLTARLGMTMTELVSIAIDRMYRCEVIKFPEQFLARDENGEVVGFYTAHPDGTSITLKEVAEANPETFREIQEMIGDEDEYEDA